MGEKYEGRETAAMKLGDHLRSIRKEHKLTLKDLSLRADLSVPYLSDIERGVVNPSVETVQKLANAYNMTFRDLFLGVDEVGKPTDVTYPPGFLEFAKDTEYKDELSDDWKELLMRINFRGKRPSSKREWIELYLYLRRILSP